MWTLCIELTCHLPEHVQPGFGLNQHDESLHVQTDLSQFRLSLTQLITVSECNIRLQVVYQAFCFSYN